MSADWYANRLRERRADVQAKLAQYQQLANGSQRPPDRSTWMRQHLAPVFAAQDQEWHRFFEETALFSAYLDAVAQRQQKQDVRDVYQGQLAPGPRRDYSIPDAGWAWLATLGLEPSADALGEAVPRLPFYSWVIHFPFTLRTPYLSKDDVAFYAIDNPVRKDHTLKLPMVASTSWKGALRSAMRSDRGLVDAQAERRSGRMIRLFGNVREENDVDQFSTGALHFFPSFFQRLSLEVINPHDRATGGGEQPILFEVVPANSTATYTLLYVPPANLSPAMALNDLVDTASALQGLFTERGFGAKTSSGYGLATTRFSSDGDRGSVCLRAPSGVPRLAALGFGGLVTQAQALQRQHGGAP